MVMWSEKRMRNGDVEGKKKRPTRLVAWPQNSTGLMPL